MPSVSRYVAVDGLDMSRQMNWAREPRWDTFQSLCACHCSVASYIKSCFIQDSKECFVIIFYFHIVFIMLTYVYCLSISLTKKKRWESGHFPLISHPGSTMGGCFYFPGLADFRALPQLLQEAMNINPSWSATSAMSKLPLWMPLLDQSSNVWDTL